MAPLAQAPTSGQDHDRITHDDPPTAVPVHPTGDPNMPDPVEITPIQKMLSATSGSLLTGLLATPLDVVRVRLQSQHVNPQRVPLPADFQKLAVSAPTAFRPSNLGVTACCREVFFMNNNAEVCIAGPRIAGLDAAAATAGGAECAVEQAQQKTFNSTIDGLRKIARHEGFTTLWRGLSPTLIMAIPANIIYFTGYEWLRYNTQSPIQRTVAEPYAPLAAGAAARILAATSVSPIELFRTRLQASHGESAAGHLKDTFVGIKDMVATHGYRSLWRGLTLTLWRDVPFSGMYWWGYETIRGKLTDARERHRGRTLHLEAGRGRARRRSQSRENHRDTFTDSFIAGAGSGAIASVVTMPFDVGKTRTQVYRDVGKAADGTAVARGEQPKMVQLLWHIFRTEGVSGLFKGWIPRTLRVAPACAIMISSYEVGKKTFRGINERALAREFAKKHGGE
ncbi:mitochondrial carrier [Coniochaeta ligniaria NRRL 30616]|uniref:Mitochondrial carrier n=1 Tax=Coniochaeta ligniaria NRRL 30616 TaxID=1408157 RepID=A0A1J7JAD0_9PEZI|nr:mitochondrial carrier [Coniochaeta ligniaria NRRL 30616]